MREGIEKKPITATSWLCVLSYEEGKEGASSRNCKSEELVQVGVDKKENVKKNKDSIWRKKGKNVISIWEKDLKEYICIYVCIKRKI